MTCAWPEIKPCVGSCCAVFTFADPESPRFDGIQDEAFLRDMLIPLDLIAAAERLDRLEIDVPWGDTAAYDWEGRSLKRPERRLMMCRHWDEDTRLCTVYDQRPEMCRDYPYFAMECDYGCGFHLTHEQMWDRALRERGAEGGTPPNVVRGEN